MATGDAIAATVLREFGRLAANRKPVVRTNGVREWVPLSGIVAELGNGQLVCVALATGMKCLPAAKVSLAGGAGLHDWHAEVLAMRCFNRFLLQECLGLVDGEASAFVRGREDGEASAFEKGREDGEASASDDVDAAPQQQPFAWRDDVALHIYCSEAPCGDASMELTMAAQDDASPWAREAVASAPDAPETTPLAGPLDGRAYFSRLGTVRRKPGRADAPPTLSKSCSDKLALRQCMTLLGALAALLVAPSRGLCLRSVVLPASQYSAEGCRRSWDHRMQPVAGRVWLGGYAFVPLAVQTTDLEFAYSRRSGNGGSTASSNLAVAWTAHGINECLVNGVLRGRRAFDPAGASAVSRRRLWQLARHVAEGLPPDQLKTAGLERLLQQDTYAQVKAHPLLAARARVKADVTAIALPAWTRNEGDDAWGLGCGDRRTACLRGSENDTTEAQRSP